MSKSGKTTYKRQSSDNRSKSMDIDFGELELRVLARMREDAENTDSFKRSDDFYRVNVGELKQLLPLNEAKIF